jgi:hypothetical protein
VKHTVIPLPPPDPEPVVTTVEPVTHPPTKETTPVQARPVREVVIQIGSTGGERVEVQVIERGGAVRVHVRTADVELTAALRSNLGELVRTITEKGLQIEAWTPAETWPSASPAPLASAAEQHESPTDEHRRNRALEQWLEEFEKRFGRSQR